MAISSGVYIFCPVCQKESKTYTICEYGMPFPSFIELECRHIFENMFLDENGLSFSYVHPYRISDPKTIYDHGFNAFVNGTPKWKNPYPNWQTENQNEWQRGWQEAWRQAIEYLSPGISSNPTLASQI